MICCEMAVVELLTSLDHFLRFLGVVLRRVWIGWFRGWDLYVRLYSFCGVCLGDCGFYLFERKGFYGCM